MPVRQWSEEQKADLSRRMTGRKYSPETIARMSAAKLGKKMSDATREKLRIANTGRRASEETRRKLSAMKLGKKLGPNKSRRFTVSAEDLRHLYVDQKMFIREIADKYGVHTRTVMGRLKEYGIRLESTAGRQIGVRCGAYRGGVKISRGYRFVSVPLDSPHSRDRDGYVAEHRLVAAEMVGRVLEPEEEVHHLNFDKMDNRPENLAIFGSGSDHTKFHKYLERAGAYSLGVASKPEPCVLSKPVFLKGKWVSVVDLTA